MIARLKTAISKHKEAVKFLALAGMLVLTWVLLITFLPNFIDKLHYWVVRPQAEISAFALRSFGYEISEEYLSNRCLARLIISGSGGICIGAPCTGLELFVLFFGFIFLMKGRRRDKMWFIPAGFLSILALNIIRIIVLSLIYIHYPKYLDFNHKYTFVIIVYGAIFALWVVWINKFAEKSDS